MNKSVWSLCLLTAMVATGIALSLVDLSAEAQPQFGQQQRPMPQQGNIQRQSNQGYADSDGPAYVMIILDASYSMGAPLERGGDTKMAVAKKVIMDVVKNLPPNVQVGLRVYGQSDSMFSACKATKVLAPFGQDNRYQIAGKLVRVTPTGATPISHALKSSIYQDFVNVQGRKQIILVSDGMETCDANPCDVTLAMVRSGIDVKMDVVGFGLQDYADARRQLRCISLATKGKYYSADTSAELVDSLNRSLNIKKEVQGKILNQANP